jgi:CheY-like chemotaxis protein
MMTVNRSRPARHLRVLVVDDYSDVAESQALLLRLWGFPAHVAQTGAEALDAARTFRPDVALIDIMLPRMDGFEVAQRLVQIDGTMVLIAMTGLTGAEHRQHSAEAGFHHHLLKPIDPETLLQLLTTLEEQLQCDV